MALQGIILWSCWDHRGEYKEAARLSFLTKAIEASLDFFYGLVGNYGLAIILLTVLVRTILLPLTVAQMRSTRKMQELQPQINELRKKYKNDAQRLNKETMELYQKAKVNPLGGCLPVLLQFPIIIALFNALRTFPYKGTPVFLGLNLTMPDPHTPALVFSGGISMPLGWHYLVLPILAAVTTYLQTALTPMAANPDDPTAKSMKSMMLIFPFLIGYYALSYPTGLSLYWVTQNVFTIVQNFFMPMRPAPVKGEATP